MVQPVPNFDLVNAVLAAAQDIYDMVLNDELKRTGAQLQQVTQTSNAINVIIGITGQVDGYVVLGMSQKTALSIVTHMMGEPTKMFCSSAAGTLGELANMICGRALIRMSEVNLVCDITPPTIIRGSNVEFVSPNVQAVVLSLAGSHGEIVLSVALHAKA